MAMRRSRIKMAPNLGAKARGPAAAAAASGANRAVVKIEVTGDDSTNQYTFVPTEVATTLTSIKPMPFSTREELATLPIQEVATITKAEPAEKAAVQVPEVDQFPVGADQDEDSANIVPAEVLKGVSKITAITAVGAVQVTTDNSEQEKDVNRPGTAPPRVRNRFPRAKPNLTETGRGRIRHNSVSRSDDEEMRSPPAIQRAVTRPRQPSISESIPSPQTPQAPNEDQMKQAVQPPPVASVPEPTTPKVVKVPNTNNSLGIDLGYNTTKRVVKTEKDDETRKKPKKQERIEGPIDKTKITMRDLIHMNPVGTPMKSTLAEKERRRKARERQRTRNGEGGDTDDAQSIVSTATLQEERAEREELEVTETPEEAAADQSDAPTKPEPDEDELSAVPQVRIGANGEIILNESSLFIDNKDPDQDMKAASMELIHESDFSIPSFSYGRKTTSRLWTEMETKKFYLALSAVGTDFSLMINLFPKRTRTELKRKFKREEKSNRYLVDRAIREQQHFDQEFFDNLAKLEIDEPVPKRRRKEMKAEEDSRENQENQAEFGEQSKRKKAPAKVKEEEAEKAESAKKKRGRKPKEPTDEDDMPEDADKPTRPKRVRKKKVLLYMDSDEGGNTADEATVKDVNTTEPVPGCSNEGEDLQSNPVSMEGLPDGLKVPKPKRKRKQKVGKKEAKGKDTSPMDGEPVVDITELSDLIETNDKVPEVPQEASYVFVESTPQPDDPGSSTDPVIHVYLVSPAAVSSTEYPLSTAKVSHHPTPSPASSPLRSPPHIPATLADQLDTGGGTRDIPGKVTENTVIDITVDETEDNVTESTVTIENNVTDLNKKNAVPSVTASDVTDLNERNAVTSVTVRTDSVSAEANTVTNSDTNNTLTDSTEGSVAALTEETVDVVKDIAVELTTNHVQTLDTAAQENSSPANVISTDHVSSDDIVLENAKESACAPPQPLNGIKEASLEAPSALRQSESESTNSKTSENTKDVTRSANTMQSNSSAGNTAVTGGGTSDKPPPMTGRRRRITAMPKIPVGKRRQGGPVNVPQRPQPSAKPPAEDCDDSAVAPIDDLTAGGILLEMSNAAQSK